MEMIMKLTVYVLSSLLLLGCGGGGGGGGSTGGDTGPDAFIQAVTRIINGPDTGEPENIDGIAVVTSETAEPIAVVF